MFWIRHIDIFIYLNFFLKDWLVWYNFFFKDWLVWYNFISGQWSGQKAQFVASLRWSSSVQCCHIPPGPSVGDCPVFWLCVLLFQQGNISNYVTANIGTVNSIYNEVFFGTTEKKSYIKKNFISKVNFECRSTHWYVHSKFYVR